MSDKCETCEAVRRAVGAGAPKKRLAAHESDILLMYSGRWSELVYHGHHVDELDLTIDELKGLAALGMMGGGS